MANYTQQADTIGEIVRKAEQDYISGYTEISEHVSFSQRDNINKIDAYLNSKHISGDTDSLGREKPFFNIVTGAVNIWYRATDIDRKNIRIKATKAKDVMGAYLASVHLQDWMKEDAFGVFLNDWGRALARYGSAAVKFVEKGGKLHACVVPWNRLISDTIDFDNNPKIEVLELTEAQLRKNKAYDQEMVEELVNAAASARQLLSRERQDNKNDYFKLYEVHGEFSVATLKMAKGQEPDESDFDEYVQQMHVLSFVANYPTKGIYSDFCLVSGREKKDPYMITHLIKEDGRAMAIGAVEHLFEAQWMQNHSVKAIKDQLDLASKLIFQTSDGNFVGQNALSAIENGDIMIHEANQPLTQLQNNSHDISSLQNFQSQWQVLAREITSTPEAISGGNQPSGTAYRTVAILNQEANSLFELMTENKGLAIEAMMREYIIPYLKTKMDTSKEIAATLDAHGIKEVEDTFVRNEAIDRNKKLIKEALLQGEVPEPQELGASEAQIRQELSATGAVRFIKPDEISDKKWKDLFSDLDWDVEVEVTNEQSDKEAVLTTLTTILQTIATNPAVLQDPNARVIFNKILLATGEISPAELSQAQNAPQPAVPPEMMAQSPMPSPDMTTAAPTP